MIQSSFTILTCGCNGTGISSMISIEQITSSATNTESKVLSRVFINVGDSTQRFCLENKVKMMSINVIVITSLAPHNISGLPGLLHGLASLGSGKVTIIGPQGINMFIQVITPFVNRKYPELEIFEIDKRYNLSLPLNYHHSYFDIIIYPNSASVEGNVVAISGLVISKTDRMSSDSNNINNNNIKMMMKNSSIPIVFLSYCDHFDVKPSAGEIQMTMKKNFPYLSTNCIQVLYPLSITDGIRNHNDSIDDRIIAMINPLQFTLLFQLQLSSEIIEISSAQQDITVFHSFSPNYFSPPFHLSHDNDSTTKDVIDFKSSTLSTDKIIIAKPFLSIPLNQSSDWDAELPQIRNNIDNSSKSHQLMIKSKIQNKLNEFHDDTSFYKSIYVDRNVSSSSLLNPSQSMLSNEINTFNTFDDFSGFKSSTKITNDSNIQSAQNIKNQLFHKHTKKRLRESFDLIDSNHSSCISSTSTTFPTTLDVKQENEKNKKMKSFSFCFLGTGSAVPSKHRNNSGILLSFDNQINIESMGNLTSCSSSLSLSSSSSLLSEQTSILLDVGEGIGSQLYYHRSGSNENYYKLLIGIRLLWISHHHCDHIAGFPMLLQSIHRARLIYSQSIKLDSKITIICPPIVQQYYEFMACISGMDDMITIVPIIETLYAGLSVSRIQNITNGYITQLQSIPVTHCSHSYAIILKTKFNEKIVYSGDCRPNNNGLIRNGKYCDVLIHEATFDETMNKDAMDKKHCTITEALDVSKSMNAKYTILTHFSQRYPKVFPKVEYTTTNVKNQNVDNQDDDKNNMMMKKKMENMQDQSYVLAFDFLHADYPYEMEHLKVCNSDLIDRLHLMKEKKTND